MRQRSNSKTNLLDDVENRSKYEKDAEISFELTDNINLQVDEGAQPEPMEHNRRRVQMDGLTEPKISVPNMVKNSKYTMFTFLPKVLFDQFKYFFNFFFLAIALSQFVPVLRVGFLITYVAPLVFVLLLSMGKEAYDDYQRHRRDEEANKTQYRRLNEDGGLEYIKSSKIRVGDIVELHANERIPADVVLLKTSDPHGTVFIRTDQLDGETDWKLRRAIPLTQEIESDFMRNYNGYAIASAPTKEIYEFVGYFCQVNAAGAVLHKEPLSLENTMWANTVVCSGKVYALVIYTGQETRAQLNSSIPEAKFGIFDQEINRISKALFVLMVALALLIVALDGFDSGWVLQFFRFVLLLSSIIPISMKVNLDLAKIYYCQLIANDEKMPETIARNSTIPEELGRVQFLLTDKTGTLTKNDMTFKRLSLKNQLFSLESFPELTDSLQKSCGESSGPAIDVWRYKQKSVAAENEDLLGIGTSSASKTTSKKMAKLKRNRKNVTRDAVSCIALCHNVTPVMDEINEEGEVGKTYQASSPDEIALVKMADSCKMELLFRDQENIRIRNANGVEENYEVLAIFPFSSETKRMGILLKFVDPEDSSNDRIVFFLKGAEVVVREMVSRENKDWIDDECETLAREGFRTLLLTQKVLTQQEYEDWSKEYQTAKSSMVNREENIRRAAGLLEKDMEFLAITGVEDKLQDDVGITLETLKNAGIKIWMLTGDKVETAQCVAISSRLRGKNQKMFTIKEMEYDPETIRSNMEDFANKSDAVLFIDGKSLQNALNYNEKYFFDIACRAPAVVCCRCSPTQKTAIVASIQKYTKNRTCSVGDGGNDVGMIQQSDVGIGIVGKEGLQASLASDFSITEFKYLSRLLLWHGRLSYKRSSIISQFVIHRGLIISVIQFIFSCLFYFVSIPIFNGLLMLGYSTIYTQLPVFSLALDEDVNEEAVFKYPLLYNALQKGRALNMKTFLYWVWSAIYQATVITLMGVFLFSDSYLYVATITFTALIIVELLNVFTTIHKLHPLMAVSEAITIIVYISSMILFKDYLAVEYIATVPFAWKMLVIVMAAWVPLWIGHKIKDYVDPSEEQKVMRHE
eukprot:CAMPEP_0114996734 /NCGR_PEP_ID=MMETSP0216-20121206/14491_1 /TAXON_ID=223996 /ORGANISM="Protocruzia adherens, Strain Boccale" /LENGTH=1088 /DNA_ID=CAMNT_0002361003 /DNA_START=179 /DNA_END=3445 /DNA_ORIENTATION=+